MKTLILSDIHSNIIALEAIWVQEKDSDFICCTGDLVDWGPHPQEVIAWIKTHDVLTTQGNHDQWVCMNYRQGNIGKTVPLKKRGWEHHNAAKLSEADIRYLESLPEAVTFELDGIHYGLTHLVKGYDELVSLHAYEQFRQKRFGGTPFTRLILGHTHRQAIRYLDNDLLWLNPGSVSYRRQDDPDQTAHYMTIVNGRIQFHRLDYDFSPLYKATQKIAIKEGHKTVASQFWKPPQK